jgi:hypothetical protein
MLIDRSRPWRPLWRRNAWSMSHVPTARTSGGWTSPGLPLTVADGRRDVALIRLPLISQCGSKRCQVIVSGRAYR